MRQESSTDTPRRLGTFNIRSKSKEQPTVQFLNEGARLRFRLQLGYAVYSDVETKRSPRLELSLKPILLDTELRGLWELDSLEFELKQLFQRTDAHPLITHAEVSPCRRPLC